MKAIISRTELIDLIGAIHGVVPSRLALPILANILIEAFDGKLIVSATDLTISARAEREANVIKEGAVTIPAKQFFQLVREMTAQHIELECREGEIAYIKSGSSHFRIHGMCKSAFPELPHMPDALTFSLLRKTFKEVVTKSLFAIAREDSRHVLNGVLMRIEHNRAIFVGTDGKRLAKVCTPISTASDHQRDYLLPLKACEEMVKMVQNEREEQIHLYLLPNKVGLTVGTMTLVTLLLSGKYPDIERVIPTSSEKKFILHREELMSLLKQISLFTSKDTQSVHLIFHPGELTLTAASHEIGDGKVAMPVDYSGEKFEIALNPFFLHDILRHCRDETVAFEATHAHNPGLITDSSTAHFVIMPMRLDAT